MAWKEQIRGGLKSSLFWAWTVVMILVGAMIQQWAAPALIDLIEADPLDRTEVRYFQPFVLGTEPTNDLMITRRVRGECLDDTSSGNFGNSNAVRCFLGGGPVDPCFSATGAPRRGEELICVTAPWEREGIMLTVTRIRELEIPTGQGLTDKERQKLRENAAPWAIELNNGERCIFAQGATLFVADQRINYICSPSDEMFNAEELSGVVIGEPDRTEDVWRVQFSETGSVEFKEELVRTAWW